MMDAVELNQKLLVKTARDLVSEGEILLKRWVSLTKAEAVQFRETVLKWRQRFTELVDNEDLHDSQDLKAIKGVPNNLSQRLWEIDGQLSAIR
jgi:hypothetical protein